MKRIGNLKRAGLGAISSVPSPSSLLILSLSLCLAAVNLSCTSKPSDLRTLVPAETLIYLETNDLASAIQPILDTDPFKQAAQTVPDISALKGVQLAVAVTGFETSEERLTDENSVGRVQPRFVAVADTHAWNYQAVGFAEKKLGGFVADVYRSEPLLEKTEKLGGKYFTWTAKDGRKAFALVIDSLIYFGNDATAIEKCVAVKKGDADSISKTGKLPNRVPESLASGYVSTDGVAQIAALAGLSFATQASDDEEVQSAVAGLIPQVLRKSITDITWVANKTDDGIEDTYSVGMPPEIAKVFNETMAPGGDAQPILFAHLSDVASATRYNLKAPQVAWNSALLVLQKQTGLLAAKLIQELSNTLLEPYGIVDPAMFLSAVDSNILTVSVDSEGEKPFLVATVRDNQKVTKSIVPLRSNNTPTEEGVIFLRTADDDVEAVFPGNSIIIGSIAGVGSGFDGGAFPGTSPDKKSLKRIRESGAAITTIGKDPDSAQAIADILSDKKSDNVKNASSYVTETRFTTTGIERRTVSDVGFVGWIIAQVAAE